MEEVKEGLSTAPFELAFGLTCAIVVFCVVLYIFVSTIIDRWKDNTTCPQCGAENTKSVLKNFGCWKCGHTKP